MKLNLIKDGSFDMEAAQKYVANVVKIDAWKPLMQQALTNCQMGISGQSDVLQSKTNLTKTECDVFYMYLPRCINIFAFAVS